MPLLHHTDFPSINRGKLVTLQINVGYKCNQACLHCHVNASPKRKEMMSRETVDIILDFLRTSSVKNLDVTGGAPELNPYFRYLVRQTKNMDKHVIDRCNLTILKEPGQEDLVDFLASHNVEIIASLPCYLEENVNKQRGEGVFDASIWGLQKLNARGYGRADSGRVLNLVYNPIGPTLPPPQDVLEKDYKDQLKRRFGIEFNQLFTLTNMPIARFGSTLVSKNNFADYMKLLYGAHREENIAQVMCRNLISVDYLGYVYDCDFNQMLGIGMLSSVKPHVHLKDLLRTDLEGNPIMVADHCYGCTAGQGSSCGGALS